MLPNVIHYDKMKRFTKLKKKKKNNIERGSKTPLALSPSGLIINFIKGRISLVNYVQLEKQYEI